MSRQHIYVLYFKWWHKQWLALFPVSDKPPTQPPVKVVGRCNPNPVNTSKSSKKRGRFVVKIKLTNVRICSLNSTQLNSISIQLNLNSSKSQLKLLSLALLNSSLFNVISIFSKFHNLFYFGHISVKFCSFSIILDIFQQPRRWAIQKCPRF